jgi:phage baseplate assembly protein W
MAIGYSVALPITRNEIDGFRLNKSLISVAKQNLKMLVLTNPGERIMLPAYGVGIRHFLFEALTGGQLARIESRILEQVTRYLPYIDIVNITFSSPLSQTSGVDNPGTDIDQNFVGLRIVYSIPDIIREDFLDLMLPGI